MFSDAGTADAILKFTDVMGRAVDAGFVAEFDGADVPGHPDLLHRGRREAVTLRGGDRCQQIVQCGQ